MNVQTGELKLMDEQMAKKLGEDWAKVPKKLEPEAKKVLNGKQSTVVNLKDKSPLARWAKHKRDESKKKARKKMAKASKKRNR